MTSPADWHEGRLVESMPSRAIDLQPRLARAIDTLAALCEANCGNVFLEITHRVDAWASRGFGGSIWRSRAGLTATRRFP